NKILGLFIYPYIRKEIEKDTEQCITMHQRAILIEHDATNILRYLFPHELKYCKFFYYQQNFRLIYLPIYKKRNKKRHRTMYYHASKSYSDRTRRDKHFALFVSP